MRCILAAFDYYYNQQSYGYASHPAVIIPKNCIGGHYGMNRDYENHPTGGGYTGSEMFTTTLPALVTPLQTALNNHIITYKNILSSSVSSVGDWKVVKCMEYQAMGIEMPYNLEQLHADRQSIRDEINTIQNEISNLRTVLINN